VQTSFRLQVGFLSLASLLCLTTLSQAAVSVSPIGIPGLWKRMEFRIAGVPSATNAFNPDHIRVDAAITLPSGKAMVVPAFWYQPYRRALVSGREQLTSDGAPEWRIRFHPPESGAFALTAKVYTNNQWFGESPAAAFTVPATPSPTNSGYVRVAENQRYFETSDGEPLRLIGENVCWHHERGTYDYDDWFGAMKSAGQNFARLWMCPWAFQLEAGANTLNRYRMDSAWQLDHVFELAAQKGIYLLLCLDYHGMFESTPDYWGGNNMWTSNPYNATNGGPCLNQNAFFTNQTARSLYQKRLRYLVGRYGGHPNLLAWEFFNEIDNVYQYLSPADVAAWHGIMGRWLHTNDPYHHLITTSLTGGSERPELWSVPELDFGAYHSYGDAKPALRLRDVAQNFVAKYGKPVMVGEFGTDWRGWNREGDPFLRGFRQCLWGGALGGSTGAMPWWWENIHGEKLYPLFTAMGGILNRTGWGRGDWTNIVFRAPEAAPQTVGDLVPGGQPFMGFLSLNGGWGGSFAGALALPDAAAAADSATVLNSFVHGGAHPELRTPFRLSAWLTNNARLVMHLNSVSGGASLVVRVDGSQLYRTNLANPDGTWTVNNEYNIDLAVNLPAGKRLIEIVNAGVDWFYLDWVRLEQVLPATYAGGWQAAPDAIGMSGARESLLYVVAPRAGFPANATNAALPLQAGLSLTLSNWPAGDFIAEWYHPTNGLRAGTTRSSGTNGLLRLPIPDFKEDLAGILYSPPRFTTGAANGNPLLLRFDSETGGRYELQRSQDLSAWEPFDTITNVTGSYWFSPMPTSEAMWAFFRALQQP
jgi:hypothetical protein